MCQVPTCGSNGERSLKWIFEKYTSENSQRLSLLSLPMTASTVFKKLLSSEKEGSDTTVSKSSGGLQSFDKKKMNAGVVSLVQGMLYI